MNYSKTMTLPLNKMPNIPITELEYDDRIDHRAAVSVMESLSGTSLLIENMRNKHSISHHRLHLYGKLKRNNADYKITVLRDARSNCCG